MPQAREFARLTKETTYGTAQASPSAGDRFTIDIDRANGITVRETPIQWSIRSAGGSNRRRLRGSQQVAVGGKISTVVYASQVALLMDLCFGITGTPYDLPSFTLDDVVVMEDTGRTAKYNSYLGCKVTKAKFMASNKGDSCLWQADLDIAAKQPRTITSSDFAEPALTTYPTGPFVLQQTTLDLDGALTDFESVTLNVENIIPTDKFFESQYIQGLPWCGRNVSMDIRALFKTAQHRADFIASTAKSLEMVITDGTTTATFTFNDANYYTNLTEDRPLDNMFMLDFTLENDLDTAAGSDVTVVIS